MKQDKESIILGYDIHDPEQFSSLVVELKDKMLQGETARQALGISDEEMESIYSVAYRKYQHGEYKSAAEVFRYLLVLDGTCYKYILGMAASLQRLGDFDQAVQHYLLASFHEPENPIPYFHAAECLLQIGNRDVAATSLRTAVINSGELGEYRELKERARLILNTLEQEEG